MVEVPGLKHDVAFGAVNERLPDWRKEEPDIDDPETADEPDDHSEVLANLFGYDSSWWSDDAANSDDAKAFSSDDWLTYEQAQRYLDSIQSTAG